MANLGIALGAGAQAFQNSFANTLRMIEAVRDMKEKEALSDALKGLPKEGDEIPLSDQAANEAIDSEARRLGIQVDPSLPRAEAVKALNAARRSQGLSGDFVLPSGGRYTREQMDAELARRLRATGSLRGLQLASELERSSLQNQQTRMEINRRGWEDMALRASAALANGDIQGALVAMEHGYNTYGPGGPKVRLSLDGEHVIATRIGDDGKPTGVAARFANLQDAVDTMLNFSSPQAYQAWQQRLHAEREGDKNRAVTMRGQDLAHSAAMAGVGAQYASIQAANAREAARLGWEREKWAEGAGQRAQEAEMRNQQIAAAQRTNRLATEGDELTSRYNALVMNHRRTPEQQAELEGIAERLGSLHPERLRTVVVEDDLGRKRETLVNPWLMQAQRPGSTLLTPNSASVQATLQQLGRRPTPDQIEAARQGWEQSFVGGAEAFDKMVLPLLQPRSRRGGLPVTP